jgi:hypothetical protein
MLWSKCIASCNDREANLHSLVTAIHRDPDWLSAELCVRNSSALYGCQRYARPDCDCSIAPRCCSIRRRTRAKAS